MHVVVKRSQWMRGEPGRLADKTTGTYRHCIMGFVGLACGIPAARMRDLQTPSQFSCRNACYEKWPQWSRERLATHAMSINDGPLAGSPEDWDAEREAALTELLLRVGAVVQFID